MQTYQERIDQILRRIQLNMSPLFPVYKGTGNLTGDKIVIWGPFTKCYSHRHLSTEYTKCLPIWVKIHTVYPGHEVSVVDIETKEKLDININQYHVEITPRCIDITTKALSDLYYYDLHDLLTSYIVTNTGCLEIYKAILTQVTAGQGFTKSWLYEQALLLSRIQQLHHLY